MNKTIILFLFLLLFFSFAHVSAKESFPDYQNREGFPDTSSPLEINVNTDLPPVIYDHSLSSSQIRRSSSGLSVFPAHNAGLTRFQMKFVLDIDTSASNRGPGGRKHFWVDQIHFTISSPSIIVYIASEYPVGSCNYHVTMAHENTHVAEARELIAKYAEKIESALKTSAVPSRSNPLSVTSVAEGEEKTKALIKAIIYPLIDDLKKTMKDKFDRMDSPSEYQRVSDRCAGW